MGRQKLENSLKKFAREIFFVGIDKLVLKCIWRVTWVAQLVRHLALDLSSDLDLTRVSSRPAVGSILGIEPT